MNRHIILSLFYAIFVLFLIAAPPLGGGTAYAGPAVDGSRTDQWKAINQRRENRVTHEMRKAAAERAAATRQRAQRDRAGTFAAQQVLAPLAVPAQGGTPNYFGPEPNWANSPLPTVDPVTQAVTGGIRKFVDSLPGLNAANANNLGQYIPVAIPDTTTYQGCDYYEIELGQYTEQMHTDLQPTTLRGYRQTNTADTNVSRFHYLGPLIVAQKGRPVRIKFTNSLPTGAGGNLFLPVDTTAMGAGMGPLEMNVTPGYPMNYTENRATIHLHGGLVPWISDGTQHQWITPAGELTDYPTGVSVQNVPDMPNPGAGSMTFYYSNEQSARLMFYHDHAFGITRLNVYAGEASGYLLTDATEQDLIARGIIPDAGIPLVIQDRTFVDPATILTTDPTWPFALDAALSNLWLPHVYMPNQDPNSLDGVNPLGRWDYGPWFWPPWPVANPPITLPDGTVLPNLPDNSMGMEAFMDTPIVNGTAYPYLVVEPRTYRFRILNAANDRFWNLQFLQADPAAPTEVQMVNFDNLTVWPAGWPTPDMRDGGIPDPTKLGPEIIQIGNECGFLPASVVWPNIPIGWDRDPKSMTVGNILEHNLFLGPAERADVLVDFSAYAGQTLILYNDAPAAVPARDPRYDYYTGNQDLTAVGGAPSTLPGYGPNIRTIMQVRVAAAPVAPAFDKAALDAEFASTATTQGVFARSQDPIIVPQAPYNSAYNGNFPANFNAYGRIQSLSLTFTPLNGSAPVTIPFAPKAIAEEFNSDWGRMAAFLGVEMPFTNGWNQTTIFYRVQDPVTEVVTNTVNPTITPIGATGDGTQLWKITHNGVDTHPVHVHLFNVQVINRVDWAGVVKPPEPNELGWKETVRMNPLEDVIVALRPTAPTVPFDLPDSVRPLDPTMPIGATAGFTNMGPDGNPVTTINDLFNFGWEYVWHCHILSHEEMDMMRPLSFLVAPGRPLTVTAVAGDGSATVSFAAPVGTGGSPITGYAVTSSPAGGLTNTGAASPITVTGLTNGTSYTFTVTATNAVGTGPASAPSNAVMPTAPIVPGPPTAVSAVAGNASATVSFLAPASNGGSAITGYTVTSSPAGGVDADAGTTATTHTITGLTNGTSYTFTVTATNATGTGPASAPSNAVTPATTPGAPTAVTAVAGNASATVSFTAPVSNGGSAITLYTVTSNPAGGLTNTGTASPITVTGLTNGTPYTFTVTATNTAGTGPASAASASVTPVAAVPGAPTAVTAVAGNASATVSFTAPVSNGGSAITGYTVTSSPAGGVDTNAGMTVTSHSITGLTNGTTYTFTVIATNVAGPGPASAPSNAVTPASVPGAPTAVTAVAGNTSATVSFTAPASNGGSAITLYTVTSSPAGGVTNTGTASPITVTGLTNGTAYTFTVTATNAAGTGPASAASAPVTPATVPGAPTAVTAAAGNASATVSFTAPASNGGSAITGYTVTSSPAGGVDANAGSTATSHNITGLTNGTSYTFTVRATNAAGTGPASAASNAVTPATVPGAPTAVTAVAGNASATVSFAAPASNGGSAITGYTVTSSPAGGVDTNAGSTATSHTITGLTNGTPYSFTVTATNALGTGPASAASNVVTPAAGALSAPTGLAAALSFDASGQATVRLTWTDNSNNETGFTVQRALNSAFTSGLRSYTAGANVTTYTDSTGDTNVTYYYRVYAYNASGNSTYSNMVTVTTSLTAPAAPTNLAVVSRTRISINISWTDNASNEKGFYVQRAASAAGPWINIGTVAANTATAPSTVTYTSSGLTNNRTYWYRVRSYNSLGMSAFSNVVSGTTLP